MNPAQLLYMLQQMDLEMASHDARLQEIEATLASNQALEAARAALQGARERLRHAQARLRDLELAAENLAAELRRTEDQLYSGRVRNPKELEGLQGKARNLRDRRAAMEDQILEAMILSEEASEEVKEAEARVARLEAEWAETQRALAREREERRAQLAEVRQRREELVAAIRPADLQVYQMVRARRGSHVVALVEGRACRECGITLPTAVVQRAREGQELTRCPNCDRILFAGE